MRKITLVSVSLCAAMLTLTAPSFAGGHSYSGSSHCGSGSGSSIPESTPDTSVCESSLGEFNYNLLEDGVDYGTNPSNSEGVNIDGVNISVSTWSDTTGGWSKIDGQWVYNAKVEQSDTLTQYGSYGYGLINDQDSSYGNNHALDNNKMYVNSYGTYYDATDFDFVLFSFDTAVTLTGASFGWVSNQSDSQVSVAALSDLSSLMSGTSTWTDIIGSAITAGSFDITYCDPGYVSNFDFSETAKYWLVGAYNTVFGDNGGDMYNDAFKLASVGFNKVNTPESGKPNAEVSEPASVALLFAAGGLIAWRRNRSHKRIV